MLDDNAPRQPWHADRQQTQRDDRLWILDADGLLVGFYDVATGHVACCRSGAAPGLDAFVAGWYAASFTVATQTPTRTQPPPAFPPPQGEPVTRAAFLDFGASAGPVRGPQAKEVGFLPVGAAPTVEPFDVPAAARRPMTVSWTPVPMQTVNPNLVPPPAKKRRGEPEEDHAVAASFVGRMFASGTAAVPRRDRT
jgi:hypothetical protein